MVAGWHGQDSHCIDDPDYFPSDEYAVIGKCGVQATCPLAQDALTADLFVGHHSTRGITGKHSSIGRYMT